MWNHKKENETRAAERLTIVTTEPFLPVPYDSKPSQAKPINLYLPKSYKFPKSFGIGPTKLLFANRNSPVKKQEYQNSVSHDTAKMTV
jgi:hypothetical protein